MSKVGLPRPARLLVKAHLLKEKLVQCDGMSLGDIAELGHTPAQSNLTRLYLMGLGVKRILRACERQRSAWSSNWVVEFHDEALTRAAMRTDR